MEKTLIIFKPDAVQRGVVGEILSRFEKVGLSIVGIKMVQPNRDHYHHHYETIGKVVSRRGQDIFEATLAMMQEGPVIAAVLEGVDAASLVRKMVGATEPHGAAPGTIRGDYTHMSYRHGDSEGIGIPNIIHASGDKDEAKLEIEHWFGKGEIYNYDTAHRPYTQRRKSDLKKS